MTRWLVYLLGMAGMLLAAPTVTGAQLAPVPPSATGAAQGIDWFYRPNEEHREHIGQRFGFTCPPNGVIEAEVWGTDVYTDDSGLCVAAVHAGVITTAGGSVTVEFIAGQGSYRGSTRNGVTSLDYDSWPASFRFVLGAAPPAPAPSAPAPPLPAPAPAAPPAPAPATGAAQGIGWTYRPNEEHREHIGQRFGFTCPPNGVIEAEVWGTDVYTDDSGLCVAAVHAGVITLVNGGPVTVEIIPGQGSYRGSTRNGVTSFDYDSWPASFRFVR